jgi:hypothetical protein
MTATRDEKLTRMADAALADGVVSATIFLLPAGGSTLQLAAAAGVDGAPLERLTEAVRNPDHPIARTLVEARAMFDVQPMAPGGPALRSHLPIFVATSPATGPVGVLAVAHDAPLDTAARDRLERLAEAAAAAYLSEDGSNGRHAGENDSR